MSRKEDDRLFFTLNDPRFRGKKMRQKLFYSI